MKTKRNLLFIAALAITLSIIVVTIAAFGRSEASISSGSKTNSELYNPLIVFAPGFTALLEVGY